MSDASTIQILYDNSVDLTSKAVITGARFTSSAAASTGTADITLKDPARNLTLVTGRRLKLLVDGIPLWAGFVGNVGRGSFFSAGDGLTNTKARKWTIRAHDNNILFDTRFLRRPADYLRAIPNITTDTFDGAIIRGALANYFDMPSWVDISTFVDDVMVPADAPSGHITSAHPWAYPTQGTRLRELVQTLAERFSGAVFYIGPDDAFHYHAIQNVESPWGFSDRPNGTPITHQTGFEGAYRGFRDLQAEEDGTEIVTDALVWGGSEWAGAGQTVFARATDATLEALHNKWQMVEANFGQPNYKNQTEVTQRANVIVYGNVTGDASGAEPGSVQGEGPRGLRFPQWAYTFTWQTRSVPLLSGTPRHIYPGDLVSIQLWNFSQDGGVTPFLKYLPLRELRISFPAGVANGKAVVQFDGTFDLRNEDSHFLWAFLRERNSGMFAIDAPGIVTGSSTSATYGAFGTFTPTPSPNGVATVFTIPFGYLPDTTQVYLNGLLQRVGVDYTESGPDAGQITFTSAPLSTDTLYVTCRTQAG